MTLSPDDDLDLQELSKKINESLIEILGDNELGISIAAIIYAVADILEGCSENKDEAIVYKKLFNKIFDSLIENKT